MKFIVFGASGKMGELIIKEAEAKGHDFLKGFSSVEDLEEIVRPDVAIDFSHADFFDEALSYCMANKIPLVSGTTGLSGVQEQNYREAANVIPLLWASNTSMGIQVLRSLLKPLACIADWDYHIVESHHIHKKDAPSGTAKTLQQDIQQIIHKDVEISAIRGGGIFGEHEIRIMGEAETISLKHTALSRKLFAQGAVKAAEFLAGQSIGLFTMDDVLEV
tara:strand:- start:10802 stop:11458 length:657 start_codon:yes stop_codon:yes gene_type:complete